MQNYTPISEFSLSSYLISIHVALSKLEIGKEAQHQAEVDRLKKKMKIIETGDAITETVHFRTDSPAKTAITTLTREDGYVQVIGIDATIHIV